VQTAGSYAAHSEMLRTEKGRRKGTDSAQRDKPRGEAPNILNPQCFNLILLTLIIHKLNIILIKTEQHPLPLSSIK